MDIRGMRTDIISRIKLIIRCILPAWAYGSLGVCKDWIAAFAVGINFLCRNLPVPKTILFFGVAPGDDLLCTAVLRELRNRGRDPLLMISNYRELFIGNKDAQLHSSGWQPQLNQSNLLKLSKVLGRRF